MKLSTSVRKNHEALWNWLAENPDKQKWDWPVFLEIPLKKRPRNDCFLCQSKKYGCHYSPAKSECPLYDCMNQERGLYGFYIRAVSSAERVRYAKKIANCFNKDKPFKEVKL